MVRKMIRVVAGVAYGFLVAHGWYRSLYPTKREPRKLSPEPLPKPPPRPVVIVAASKKEADEIAELLGDDHTVVGYIQNTTLLRT